MRHLISSLLLGCAALSATAQEFPSRPISFIVQYAPGSGADQLVRVITDVVHREHSARFVIRNIPGAVGVIGTTTLVKSPADGYTIGICSASINSAATSLMKSLPYDTTSDFTFIEPLASYTYVVSSAPELGFTSLDELIRHSAANPDKLSYMYSNATAQVLAASLTRAIGLKALPVPYKATQEGLNDLSQNRVSFGVTDTGVTAPMVRTGKVKALAVIAPRRSISLPDVPSLVELGKPAIDVMAWAGVCGPKDMPSEAVTWLRERLRKARNDPDTLEKFKLLGLDPINLGSVSFPDFVAAQLNLWTEAARNAGIQPQ
ncbi:MAG: tripartite tricarboxylate transporter substrate binding protein [Burkholderiales bacterium]|nr:tripartite tricarboxylate transporter substrate binding protein [Burkholderiales bacterium]